MRRMSHRLFLAHMLLFAGYAGLSVACAETEPTDIFTTEPIIASAEPPDSGWSRLAIIDLDKFPWDETPRFNARTKTIFRGPEVGQLVYTIFPPTWSTEISPPGLGSHYHTYYEWGYTIEGDSTLTEPVNPYQKNGMYYRKSQGGWLTRPPYSLHGGSWVTGGKRAQLPYHLLLFEEGDGSLVTVGPDGDHFFPEYPDRKPDPYLPDWQSVERFTRPWLVDSLRDLEWEKDSEVEGRLVKWLDDDVAGGFRARLVKISPDWTPPGDVKGHYFEKANRFRYVLYGDMKVWLFEGADDDAPVSATVGEDFFIYQPARSLWGYGAGPVSENGAIWLEVTYSSGVSHGGGPIEEPTVVR